MKYLIFLLLSFNLVVKSQVINLNSGLTACYSLDGSATEVINNLNGVLSGVTPTVNRFNSPGTAMEFSGSSASYIELYDNVLLKPSNAISFSCWIKTPTLVDQYILFTKNSMSSYFEAFNLCINPSLNFMTRKGGTQGVDMIVSTTSLAVNTWYHLVTTIDDSEVRLYVNGVLESSTQSTFSGFDYVQGKKVFLGTSNEPGYDAPFIGTMDNVRFYNRTLNAAEVAALYNQDPTCEVAVPTSISKNEISNLIHAYPNPTSGLLTVKMESNSVKDYILVDLLGNLLTSSSILSDSIILDLSYYPSGIYFLKVKVEGQLLTKKIVKE